MTVVNPKSISGINSITTGSGSDNLLTIHTSDASSTERVRINSSGDVIVGSGITVSPDGDIFATGVTTSTTFVGALTGNVTGNISGGTVAGSTGTFTGDVSIADKIVHTGDTNTAIRFSGADTIKLETSGTERFQVDSSGNIYVGGVGGSATSGTLWFNDTSANASKIAQSNGNSALTFHTGSSQPERLRIDSGGNVNFGAEKSVSLPSGTGIQVYHSANPRIRLVNDTTGNGSTDGTQIYLSSDGDTIIDNKDSEDILIQTNASEKLRIKSDGKIGIGLDSPNCLLHIQDAAISGYGSQSGTLLVVEDSGDSSIEIASGYNNTGSIFFGDTGSSNKGQINYLHGSGGDAMTFQTDGSEQLRITSGGNLLIATTSTVSNGTGAKLQIVPANNNTAIACKHTGTNDGNIIELQHQRAGTNSGTFSGTAMSFRQQDGTQVGTIVINNTSTSFNTSSDYRLKENTSDISDGITRLKTLKPYRFNFKGDSKIVDGFFAHEVTAVPEAITGTKDEVDENGDPKYQAIDQSKLVPLLTAALQEAVTKIEVLETRLNNAGIAT